MITCPNCEHVFEVSVPDWYDILVELSTDLKLPPIPPLADVMLYVESRLASLTSADLEEVAIAVSGQWGSKGWKWVNPYRVFQTWARMQVKRNRADSMNGTALKSASTGGEARRLEFVQANIDHKAAVERDKGKWTNE